MQDRVLDIEAINQLRTTFSVEQYFTYREIILNEKIRGPIENCDNNFLKNFDRHLELHMTTPTQTRYDCLTR